MEIKEKECYKAPKTEVFKVKGEGVICQSIPATIDGIWGEEDI
ncbi:MAG: hypothetical protein SPL35_05735 [Bacteroidales bacterium]|nr:hypothetical protein [Bacteroidales bacterium]